MFQIVFEFGIFLLVVLVGLFQIILPLVQKRKVFPMFRAELSNAEKGLTDIGQKVAVESVIEEQKELEEKLKQKNTKTKKGL
jgi:hypothetical protein